MVDLDARTAAPHHHNLPKILPNPLLDPLADHGAVELPRASETSDGARNGGRAARKLPCQLRPLHSLLTLR